MSEFPAEQVNVDIDLDAERPATFRLQGEVFKLRQMSYRAFARADQAFMARINALGATDANGSEPVKEPSEEQDVSEQNDSWLEQLDAYADFVEANTAEDDVPRFRALRDLEDGGIQQRDLMTMRRWLWEAQTGRPLTLAAASSSGPGSSDPSSRDESGSVEVVRPT